MKTATVLFSALLFTVTAPVHAAILISSESSTGVALTATPWFGKIADADLVNAGQPTLASRTQDPMHGSFQPNGLNDGLAGASNVTQNAFIATEGGGIGYHFNRPGNEWWVTFDLNVATNTAGYDISSIESFLGWNSASELQANQLYSVELSTTGSSAYAPLTSVSYTPFASVDGDNHYSHVAITEDMTAILAANVDSIRFRFNDPGTGAGGVDGTVINELNVYGVASAVVPEPSSLLLAGVIVVLAAGRLSSRS